MTEFTEYREIKYILFVIYLRRWRDKGDRVSHDDALQIVRLLILLWSKMSVYTWFEMDPVFINITRTALSKSVKIMSNTA